MKNWLDHLVESLKHGGWHPPVVLINNRLVSQGTVPTRERLVQSIRAALASSQAAAAKDPSCENGKYFAIFIVLGVAFYLWPVTYWLGPRHWSATAAIFAVLLLGIEYHRRYSRTARDRGFSWPDFLPGFRLALMFTTVAMIAVAYAGWVLKSLVGRHHPERDLAGLLLWALAQQFILQTVVLRELERRMSRSLAIFVAAAVFALLHMPNPFLFTLTFAGACIWCWIYSRHPNLIPLALSHSLTTLMILACLSKSMTGSMRVGYAYFLL